MYDLDYFLKKKWAFILIKNDKIIYKSKSQGLKPLVFCLKSFKKEMEGAVAYDKIVGLAAAMFLAYGKVKEVWTPTISKGARKYLKEGGIKIIYRKEVKNILNRDGSDLCPIEKIARRKTFKDICGIFKI